MFQRLHELSALFPEKELWQRLNEGMPAEYNRQLALCFSEQGQWREVKTAILNESNHDNIIYRSGPSNGTDLTPCCKLASNTANRLLKAVKNLANYTHLPANKREQLQASIQTFEKQADEIWQQVESKVQSAGIDGKTKRGFVCWVIDSQLVYEWEETKAFLTEQFLEPFTKGGIRQGSCLVCGQLQVEVFGNFNILACYNLDKRGSIAGGFVEEAAHRNFPVCRSCTIAIAEAFTFAESYLTSHMAGQSYMLLPYASTPIIREELHSYFQKKPERFQLAKACDLVSQELEWLEEFSEPGDQIALALIFFHAENNAWRIQAELQQVLPSRLHELQHAAKKLAEASDLASDFDGENKPFHLTAMTFKNFAGSWEKTSVETLRAWLVALFEKRLLDEKYFLHRLVSKIINIGKSKPEFLGWITRQAWGLYRYALLTELIKSDSNLPAKPRQEIMVNSIYGQYIQEHADFFNQPEKIVAFLTGCYAATVVATQKKERNATPFAKKFIGRLLSQTHLQRLYREGHDKLAQYDKLGYVIKGLDPDLAAAWIACGEHWHINNEEATFAFTIGYSLEYRLRGNTQDSAAEEEK